MSKVWVRDIGHRVRDIGHRVRDIGHRVMSKVWVRDIDHRVMSKVGRLILRKTSGGRHRQLKENPRTAWVTKYRSLALIEVTYHDVESL